MKVNIDIITKINTFDIRFPTSDDLDGSDATNKDPDYSAAYVEITTEKGNKGYGLIFTIGRGNDLCCQAIKCMQHLVIGKDFNEIKQDIGLFYDYLRSDSQLRWLGPDKGVIHMAAGAIMNCIWDMWARSEGKPLWKLLSDMTAEEFVNCIDFRYVTDELTKEEALSIVKKNEESKPERLRHLQNNGYPAYDTTPGWLGYSDEKLVELCKKSVSNGFNHIKLKVGENLQNDIRRLRLARDTVGSDISLMIDANQTWEVNQAIDWVNELSSAKPWFIEEPTSPDDVFGHKKIKENIGSIKVATGEHCQNRIIFKQLIASDAIDVVQIDACRLSSINEVLTVYMLAAKFNKPVCPHAGGVGLCEYVQHLSMIDYLMVSASMENRVIEYVDHLHEHFEDPCIVQNASYKVPTQPGFSIKMHDKSIEYYTYPTGKVWQQRLNSSDTVEQ